MGVFSVALGKKSVKGLKPKQRLRSRSFCELNLRLVSKLSYRDAADLLNRVLHRDECNSIKTSTLEDWVESYGESLSDGYMSRAEEILDSYNVGNYSVLITASVISSWMPLIKANGHRIRNSLMMRATASRSI